MPLDRRVALFVRLVRMADRGGDTSIIDRRRKELALSSRGAVLVMPSGPRPASIEDRLVPVDGGQVRVRLYHPHGPGPFPLYVFLHGGGFCSGGIDERDPRCRAVAAGAGCVVASVEYRLAPENAYPTGVEDCYAALCWLVEQARSLRVDAARVAVGGESAGANLAAVLCQVARDRSGPSICHQWLDVPATDLTKSQPSMTEVPDGYLLDEAVIDEYLGYYLDRPERASEPGASPLFGELAGLPPAWIMSAEFDKLRDDGVAYAAALERAGVPVEFQVLAGHVHPSFAFTRWIPSAKAYEDAAIAALAAGFASV